MRSVFRSTFFSKARSSSCASPFWLRLVTSWTSLSVGTSSISDLLLTFAAIVRVCCRCANDRVRGDVGRVCRYPVFCRTKCRRSQDLQRAQVRYSVGTRFLLTLFDRHFCVRTLVIDRYAIDPRTVAEGLSRVSDLFVLDSARGVQSIHPQIWGCMKLERASLAFHCFSDHHSATTKAWPLCQQVGAQSGLKRACKTFGTLEAMPGVST